MGINVARGNADEIVKRIMAALGTYQADHPRAEIDLYRQNSVSVRVRIIDSAFQGMSRPQRSDSVWK